MPKVEITHGEKVLFPKDNITKMDLINYYSLAAKRILPFIKNYPISMERYPNGIKQKGFIQKNVPDYFPKWIKTTPITRKEKGKTKMLLCKDSDTLLYLVNQACITPHMWLSRADKLDFPSRMVFDLDPPEKNFSLAIDGAKLLRRIVEKELKKTLFVMTTGSKGLHLFIPIKPEYPFVEIRERARNIGRQLVEEDPKKYTLNPLKSKRRGKLFIDYLRNSYAQTSVIPYAVRALDGAPIATPIDWKELRPSLTAQSYHLNNIKRRLSKNPWQEK